MFLHPKVKRLNAMVYILIEFWKFRKQVQGGHKSGYQGQSKGARFTMKIRYDKFVLLMQGV